MRKTLKILIIAAALGALGAAAVWHGAAGTAAALDLRTAVGEWLPECCLPAPAVNAPAVGDITALTLENAELREQVAGMRQLLSRRNDELFALERALQEFEGFRRALPEVRMLAARISGRGPGTREAVVAAGTVDGAAVGNGVVQGQVLAGTIGCTAEKSSCVLFTSHPGCVVPARAGKSRDICIVRGDGAEGAVAVFYANQTLTAPGEKVFTSGLLGKLPAGLIIGTIADYPRRGEGGTMTAPVHLEADFPALENVLIVAPRESN